MTVTHPNGHSDASQIREALRRIIAEVMGIDAATIEDDAPLLDYVTSSMALVEGMRLAYDRFGVLVSIRRVLEGNADLASLSVFIAQALEAQNKNGPARRRDDAVGVTAVPLPPSQRHIAFLSRYSQGASAAYNESLALHLEGSLHAPAMQAAIEAVGDRHEALRMALSATNDVLELHSGQSTELHVSSCTRDEFEERLAEVVRRPFEAGERLFRAELLRLSESDHVLILVGHALLVDRAALAVVMNDVADIYRMVAGVGQGEPPLAPLSWREHAVGETVEQGGREQSEAYWKRVFSDGAPALELPGDRTRPAAKNYEGATAVVPIDPKLVERVQRFADSMKAPVSAVWFSGFAVLLHRLSGQADLAIGVEADDPMKSAQVDQNLVARTRELLPIRSVYDPDKPFADRVRDQTISIREAGSHAELSLGEIIQVLDLPRDQSRSPLIGAAFRAEDHTQALDFGPVHARIIAPPGSGARYELEMALVSTESGPHIHCHYSTELFDTQSVSRWVHGLLELLQAGVTQGNQACGRLPIMLERERRMLLEDWNATDHSTPDGTTLDLILAQIHTRPGRPAVRCGDMQWTYRELGQRVDGIAGMLLARGVSRGDRVAVLLPRSPDLIATLLAAWRVGALFVPLDLAFPKQRLAFMVEDAAVAAIVTTRHASAMSDDLYLDGALFLDEPFEAAVITEAQASACPSDGAYIMYTSGSTGQPKGVHIGHAGLANFMEGTRTWLGFTDNDSLLAITTVSFDISCLELFTPLIAGGVVDIGEDGLAADGIRLAERLETSKPSYMQATPSTWKALLAVGWGGDRDLGILSAGEALPRELAEQLLVRGRSVWNMYGPTETTVYSTAWKVESGPSEPMRIGRPYPNTRIYILDAQLVPLPIGCAGDLYIGGAGVAKGYWRRPELTDQRFVADPFRSGERIYRTGDLARYLPNEDIVCLGRVDDQVKVHGVRIELGEVEMLLRGVPGVRDAVVAAWTDPSGNAQLVGHVIADGSVELAPAQIRAHLRESLPEAMIPPHILFTDRFPLTANGKIHRAALPGPTPGGSGAAGAKAVPANATERLLADAWSRVLQIDVGRIGRDDAFLDLGGHSLLMTQLMLEVRKLFHISFSMRELFDAPTLSKLAARIDEYRRARTADGPGGTPAGAVRDSEWGKQRMAYLRREAELPAGIAPARGLSYEPPAKIQSLLLTGPTGFVGAYILADVLDSTDADVYCLVRPRHGVPSKSRIEDQMRAYELWHDDEAWRSEWDRRVHVVEGDVILPRLGLADPAYESLARGVDCIIHSAAHVNFIYPYEALRATNVLGVHEIIRFAFHARIKPVHYLSTAAIWPMGSEYTFHEKDSIDHGMLLNLGYDEAKWVGERCLVNAAERGLPAARYRPGEVGGDSETGRLVLSHFIVAAFRGFLQMGAFPTVDTYLDVTPVDYVAKAVVHMAFRTNAIGKAFHLTNPGRCHLSEALSYLRGLGYSFEEMPFAELRERLVQDSAFSANALFPYQAALEDMDERSLQIPRYDCRQTLRELEGTGIVCPPLDRRLLGTYLNHLIRIGYLEQPAAVSIGA